MCSGDSLASHSDLRLLWYPCVPVICAWQAWIPDLAPPEKSAAMAEVTLVIARNTVEHASDHEIDLISSP